MASEKDKTKNTPIGGDPDAANGGETGKMNPAAGTATGSEGAASVAAPPADQPKGKAVTFKLASGRPYVDLSTRYGRIRVTDEMLKSPKMVANLQLAAPSAFVDGLIVAGQ